MIPIDTMMPMMPARSMVVLRLWPMKAMIAHSRAPVTASPATTTTPSSR